MREWACPCALKRLEETSNTSFFSTSLMAFKLLIFAWLLPPFLWHFFFFFFKTLRARNSSIEPKLSLESGRKSDVSWKYFKSHKRQHRYQADEKPWYHVLWLMPNSSYTTRTGTRSGMLSQEHHSLLLQSWQSGEKSSLLMSPHDFFLIWLTIRRVTCNFYSVGNPHRP